MTAQDFTVQGQRVLVVGAARSGVAAALLLVCRGAAVTLTDRRPAIGEAATLASAGVTLELGGPGRRVHRRGSDRVEPRRAAGPRGGDPRARGWRSRDR